MGFTDAKLRSSHRKYSMSPTPSSRKKFPSTKHTLALTNRGAATTSDLIELAGRIRAGVANRFGITLVPEPVFVNCSLDDYSNSSEAMRPTPSTRSSSPSA